MKIENQVCTLEQAKKLIELGIKSLPLFEWWEYLDEGVNIWQSRVIYTLEEVDDNVKYALANNAYPAFTVAELGLMLPNKQAIIGWEVWYNDHFGEWCCTIRDFIKWNGGEIPPPIIYESEGDTMAEALANALIYCLEKGLTTAEEVNARLTD